MELYQIYSDSVIMHREKELPQNIHFDKILLMRGRGEILWGGYLFRD